MLRAGIPLAEVARRLGHSIDVLLRVYAGIFDDDEVRSNEAIEVRACPSAPYDRSSLNVTPPDYGVGCPMVVAEDGTAVLVVCVVVVVGRVLVVVVCRNVVAVVGCELLVVVKNAVTLVAGWAVGVVRVVAKVG